jgi:hypothetical protein
MMTCRKGRFFSKCRKGQSLDLNSKRTRNSFLMTIYRKWHHIAFSKCITYRTNFLILIHKFSSVCFIIRTGIHFPEFTTEIKAVTMSWEGVNSNLVVYFQSAFHFNLSLRSLSNSLAICQCSSDMVVSPKLKHIRRPIVTNLFKEGKATTDQEKWLQTKCYNTCNIVTH